MSYIYVLQVPLKSGNFLSRIACAGFGDFNGVTSTLNVEGVRLSLVTNFTPIRHWRRSCDLVSFFQSDLNPNVFLDVIDNIIGKLFSKECFSVEISLVFKFSTLVCAPRSGLELLCGGLRLLA